MTTAAVIESAAEALGMVRGPQRRTDSINTVQFSGNGTMSVPQSDGPTLNYEITETTLGISYSIPAMRWDLTRVGSDGDMQRRIQVVRGDRAWDERLPGIDPTPVEDQVSRRLRRIWLTPHGIVRAAVDDPAAVSIGSRNGRTTLAVVIDGTPVTATLDGDFRPERVEMMIEHRVLGETLLEAAYTDYVDWPKLDVYFPSRIVQTLGGETTLDLTVTEFFQNPYVVFPTPEQLNRSSQ
jgi:hypothetical protein